MQPIVLFLPQFSSNLDFWILNNSFFFGVDVVVVVAVVILVGLFSMQHYGTDKVSWLFAPIVLLWFLLIGGIGLFNIWKYDTRVLKAFSPVYIYRYFRRGGRDSWTSLGGIMLSITGNYQMNWWLYACEVWVHKSFSNITRGKVAYEYDCGWRKQIAA